MTTQRCVEIVVPQTFDRPTWLPTPLIQESTVPYGCHLHVSLSLNRMWIKPKSRKFWIKALHCIVWCNVNSYICNVQVSLHRFCIIQAMNSSVTAISFSSMREFVMVIEIRSSCKWYRSIYERSIENFKIAHYCSLGLSCHARPIASLSPQSLLQNSANVPVWIYAAWYGNKYWRQFDYISNFLTYSLQRLTCLCASWLF